MSAGGMQDFNYVWAQCLELTLELSCCKFPPPEQLPALWTDNKKALLAYIQQVHLGQNLSARPPVCPPPRLRAVNKSVLGFRGERSCVRLWRAGAERGGGGQRSAEHVSVQNQPTRRVLQTAAAWKLHLHSKQRHTRTNHSDPLNTSLFTFSKNLIHRNQLLFTTEVL